MRPKRKMDGIMSSKDLTVALLADIYGALLTERQREMIEWYYDEDLSLSEIAENVGVSRQAVRDTLERTRHTLLTYEDALGCLRKEREIAAAAAALSAGTLDEAAQKALAKRLEDL